MGVDPHLDHDHSMAVRDNQDSPQCNRDVSILSTQTVKDIAIIDDYIFVCKVGARKQFQCHTHVILRLLFPGKHGTYSMGSPLHVIHRTMKSMPR